MSVIVIRGFDPDKVSMSDLYHYLRSIINGNFRTLKMVDVQDYKICIVKLSNKLDPEKVLRDIEHAHKPAHMKIFAYIPGKKAMATNIITSHARMNKTTQCIKIKKKFALNNLFEMQRELQFKYNKLFITSMTDGHKLLDAVSEIILDRLKYIVTSDINYIRTSKELSQIYRKSHPHHSDLALLQTAHDQIQDEHGLPHIVLVEKDLIHMSKEPNPKIYQFNKVMKTAMRFTRDVTKKVETYIQSIPSDEMDAIPNPTKEDIVRMKVRRELKNLAPYLSLMVPQIVNKHWSLHNEEICKIRMYGDPYMPSEYKVKNLFNKIDIRNYNRSSAVYNMVTFTVHQRVLPKLLQMNGTYIDTAKLTIRTRPIHEHMASTDISGRLVDFLHAIDCVDTK